MAYKAERPWEREGAHSSGWGGDSRGNADGGRGRFGKYARASVRLHGCKGF